MAFVGIYVLLDSPVIPFHPKIGYLPGKQYLWMDRYANSYSEAGIRWPLFSPPQSPSWGSKPPAPSCLDTTPHRAPGAKIEKRRESREMEMTKRRPSVCVM